MEDLICNECGYKWSMELDKDGLFNGYGCPPCPNCGSGEAFRQMIMEILDVIFAEIDFADMEMVVFA